MEMIKNIAIGMLAIVVVFGIYQYINVWKDAVEKIAVAEQKQQEMEAGKAKLEQDIADLTAKQGELDTQIEQQKNEITGYEAKIAKIQEDLAKANKGAIAEVNEQSIADNFKKTYALEKIKGIRVVKIPPEGGGFKIPSLVVPIDYVKLAVTAKNSQLACEKQAELKDKIIDLNNQINDLVNEKLILEQQKTQAYSEGYEKAFAMYLEVNKLYIDLLKAPPKVDLTPSWLQVAGGVLAGGLLCVL